MTRRRTAEPVSLYPLSDDPKIQAATNEDRLAFTIALPITIALPSAPDYRKVAIEDLRWVLGNFVEAIANAYSSESRRRMQACSMIENAVIDAGLTREEILSTGLFKEDGTSKHRRYWNESERPGIPYHQRFY